MTGAGGDWPTTLGINAWAGESVSGPLGPDAQAWILGQDVDRMANELDPTLAAPLPPPDRAWQEAEVGWGVVLPDTGDDVGQQARLVDAPEPLRRLAEARAGPDGPAVFRWSPSDGLSLLRRVHLDGSDQPMAVTGTLPGNARGHLPAFLLMVGPPTALSWELQCRLNLSRAVGRLDLPDDALDRYVTALLSDDWAGSTADATKPVVWSTDDDDITNLMRVGIAEQMAARFRDDAQTTDGFRHLAGTDATADALVRTLAGSKPGVVVTTSHGRTGPLGDRTAMARDLGLLVDAQRNLVDPDVLLNSWHPDGAVWYAHACCSAGSDATTRYDALVTPGSMVQQVLWEVARLGSLVAPLPTALLCAEKPARAFIGHVEPTFDWTMERETGQILTAPTLRALYTGFFQPNPEPVGVAFRQQFIAAGELFGEAAQTNRNSRENSFERQAASLSLLAAYDRQSMVILGDPTVCPPALPKNASEPAQ